MDKSVVWRLLKEPRSRLVIFGFAALAPIVVGGLIWISRLSPLIQMVVGTLMGIASVASFHFMGQHRSHQRRRLAVTVQQFSKLDTGALKRLLSTPYFPVWAQSESEFEKVSWLNRELDEVWPFIDKAASEMLKLQLQPILDQYKFGPIMELTIKSVTLGTLSPVIGGVQFTAGGKDESTLEIEVDWRHSEDQKMVLKLKTIGPDLTVQVKDLMIYGVLRLWFKPLADQIPGFGAVVASLREPPLIDFRTKFLGGDAMKIPGLDSMVDDMIRTSLLDMLVWPSRMVFPIIPGDYSFLELHPVGILVVTLIEAKHLLKKELFSKSDPVAYLYIRQRQDHMKKSSGKSNTHHPKWNETFELQVEDVDSQKLTVRLMDQDNLNPSDFLGIAEIPLKEFEPNVSRDMWVKLVKDPNKPESESQKQRGEVHILVTYKPFGQQRNEEGLALDGEKESTQGQQRTEGELALDGEKESMQNESTGQDEKPAIQEKNYQNQVEPSLKGQVNGGESETISMDTDDDIKGQETNVGVVEEPVKSENGMVSPGVPMQAEPINA